MASIVRHALESTKAGFDARKQQLIVTIKDEPLFVNGDPVRLTQIVENLLTNATKFTEEGGKISLNTYREGCELIVSVIHNGIGIPQQMLTKLFKLFMQEGRADRKSSSGLGIGLRSCSSWFPCMVARSRHSAKGRDKAANSSCGFH